MKIYIAGPMRGIKEFNFPAFFWAERCLREAGHEVFNPAAKDVNNGFETSALTGHENLEEHGFSLRDALANDLEWIARKADAIATLADWQNSKGARAEVALAEALGLPCGDWRRFLGNSSPLTM